MKLNKFIIKKFRKPQQSCLYLHCQLNIYIKVCLFTTFTFNTTKSLLKYYKLNYNLIDCCNYTLLG